MKRMKKWFGLLLAVIMILSIVPEQPLMATEISETEAEKILPVDADFDADGAPSSGMEMHALENTSQQPIQISTTEYAAYGASEWDKYSNHYYYYQMDASQQAFYSRLLAVANNMMLTTQNAQYHPAGRYITSYVSAANLSRASAEEVYKVFLYANPQFYFLDNDYAYDNRNGQLYIAPSVYSAFANGTSRSNYTAKMKSQINTYMSYVEKEKGPFAKEVKIHNLLVHNIDYVYGTYDQSIFSALYQGKTVCAGYTKAFSLLCNAAGISTISVTSSGTATQEGHAWNKAKLYGRWYAVDCTWDDTAATNQFLNKSDVYFAKEHNTIDSCYFNWNVPVCSLDVVNTEPLPIYNGKNYGAVFDASYYMNKYPAIGVIYEGDPEGALTNFVNYGMKEGRQGCATFDVNSYRNQYADLRQAFGSDLTKYYMHYINCGKAEGRKGTGCTTLQNPITKLNGVDYSAVYDYNYYTTKYPDIKKVYGSNDLGVLKHFVTYGMKEGRQGNASFNVTSYRYQYADLRRAFGTNLNSYYMHYIKSGKKEGRKGTGCTTLQGAVTKYNGVDYSTVYDYNYYTTKYPDIKKAFGLNDAAVLAHFVNSGMKEGRQGCAGFDVRSYKNQYADLRRAFGTNLKNYYLHYINNGKKEGRKGIGCTTVQNPTTVYNGVDYRDVYDYTYYTTKYSDIKRAFGNDDAAVLRHFVNNGMKEGRQGIATFNVQTYKNKYGDLRRVFGNDLKKYYMHYLNFGKKEGRTA